MSNMSTYNVSNITSNIFNQYKGLVVNQNSNVKV